MRKEGPNKKDTPMTKVQTAAGLLTLKYNNSFCNKFFEKSKIASVVEEPGYFSEPTNLVYDVSKVSGFDSEYFGVIIDLLLQLRATQNDQNIFVQNNTVLREQILNQLKSEVLKVSHKLSRNQIKNLEVLSNNNFDEKTLTDILNSFLKGSKKKFADEYPSVGKLSLGFRFPGLIVRNLESKNTKILDIINKHNETFSKLTNYVNSKNVLHTTSHLVNLSPSSELYQPSETVDTPKTTKPSAPITKKSILKNYTEVKQLYDLLGDNIIARSQLILPLIKLQVKLSEINVLKKTRLIANEVINKTISKTIPTETQLVNKIIEHTNLSEIQEKLVYNQEQFENYKIKYQTEVKKIHSYFKKLQTDKTLTTSRNYELKINRIIAQGVKDQVNKNISKFTYQNQVYKKIENINENAIKNYLTKSLIYKDEFIYNLLEKQARKHSIKTIYNKKLLPHKTVILDENVVTDINKETAFTHEFKKRYFKNINLFEKSFDIVNKAALIYKAFHKTTDLSKLNFIRTEAESLNYNNLRFKNIDYVIKKESSLLNSSNLQEFIEVINKEKLNKERLSSENLFKSIKKLSILNQKTHLIKNRKITTENIEFINNLNLLSSLSDDFKFTKKNQIYRVNSLSSIPYPDTSHMVYKQNIIPKSEPQKVVDKPIQSNIEKDEDYTIKEVPKPITPMTFNEKEFEKKIMANTLGKKEILDLIKSQLSSINLEDISQTVLSRVESQLIMDKKRNGIF